jgi:hypothetical protein
MKRRTAAQEQKYVDEARLLRVWRQRHAEELEEALAGPDGALVSELMVLLDQLELNSAAALLDFIQRSDWNSVSYDTRLVVLHQVNDTITKMRERNGLPPFDDGLPGSRDNVFRVIRSLTPSPALARRFSPSEVATAERTGRNDTAASE